VYRILRLCLAGGKLSHIQGVIRGAILGLIVEELTLISSSDKWLAILKDKGYRLTGPRRAVVEIIATSQRLLNPLEIYHEAQKRYPRLGLVTVYRTLEKLEQLGLVERVHHSQGCNVYIAARTGHNHLLICQNCGQVTWFSGDSLAGLVKAVEGQSGYQVQDHWLQLIGLCERCVGND
jgi:Fur family transcriptional regulator, ferric uptake regulator